MALQSLPNESEVGYINTEIPHQPGDYIPNATVTKYRVGHYLFTDNGTHLMSYAGINVDPETPNVWVVPGVIDINVPPPQMDPNQNVINANGVFNLVDNDEDPDIEIEEEDNTNPNPNVMRGTLVKSNKTVKSFKLVKQGEETRDGEEEEEDTTMVSLGQIRVQVPIKLTISKVRALKGEGGDNYVTVNTSEFYTVNNIGNYNVTVPGGAWLVNFYIDEESNHIYINTSRNHGSSSREMYIYGQEYGTRTGYYTILTPTDPEFGFLGYGVEIISQDNKTIFDRLEGTEYLSLDSFSIEYPEPIP